MLGERTAFCRTTIIGSGLLAFLIGLGMARFADPLHISWLVVAFIFVVISLRHCGLPLLCSIIFIGLVLGWMRGQYFLQELRPYEELYDQKIVLVVRAQTDGVYGFRGQLEFDADDITVLEPEANYLPGRVKISGFGANAVNRGDIVQVEGKLQQTLGSRQGRIGFAEISVLGRDSSIIETLRRRFVAGMQTALPEPSASFAVGLLVGQRANLPDHVTDSLGAVGLTHIIAVSGYNLTIIMRAVRRGFRNRSKYQITVLSLALMAVFLSVTGFSASIVRAAIVSGLSLAAWYYGRTIKPLLLILIAASITAGWYPIYLWSDIGWYLSFLAFFGVLILAPLLVARFYHSNHEPKVLGLVAIESLCAQVMTIPLILWIFNEISIIAPLSNIFVVPLVPLAMLLALVAGLAGMFLPALVGWFAWPAKVLLTYMLDIVSLMARIPHVLMDVSISLAVMLFQYSVLGFLTIVLWRKVRAKHATITDTETI